MERDLRERLLAALALRLPYGERDLLSGGRPASVLVLLGSHREGGEPSLLITRRTDQVPSHKGQMAFPGGVSEPEEIEAEAGQGAGMVRTALRETEEEVGIPPEAVEVVGALPALTTVTSYRVVPVVGLLKTPIEEVELRLSGDEIAQALWIPLSSLMEPGVYRAESRHFAGADYLVHVYQYQEHRIWGATGSMLKNLLDRLASLG